MVDSWFSQWFNRYYLKLYAHRDSGEARSIASLIQARLPDIPQGLTLDLACGAGRHLRYLSRRQKTIGLDLSPWLLDVARQKNTSAGLVRGDMRALPFRNETFTLVANLFTSFGYFAEDDQSVHVLREIARITKPCGWLVLDFLNAPHARHSVLQNFRESRKQLDTVRVNLNRRITPSGRFVVKTIEIEDEETDQVFMERVRLFEPRELIEMARATGLLVRDAFGDYAGRGLSPESPRAILFAQRFSG
jgi:SAM-dependent methyltransferase